MAKRKMNIFKVSQNPTLNTLAWGIIVVLVVVVGYGLYVKFFIVSNVMGLDDFFSYLEENGYRANRTLSGHYYPGNVIQTIEEGPDGNERRLASPLIFSWHTDCFPDKTPLEAVFGLPGLTGKKTASLQVGSGLLARLFPSFQLESNAVADYTLTVQKQRLLAYARTDLDRRFSQECERSLYNVTAVEGDEETWFEVIFEAVIADSLTLEMQWKTTASFQSRAAVTTDAKKKLTDMAQDIKPPLVAVDITVGLESETEKKTVISAKGLVILGYRTMSIKVKELD